MGNADQNAPMVSMNERIGFGEVLEKPFLEFDTEDLAGRLDLSLQGIAGAHDDRASGYA